MKRLGAALLVAASAALGADEFQAEFLETYCIACHSGANAASNLRLDEAPGREDHEKWRRVRDYVARGVMPPKVTPKQPEAAERERFVEAIETAAGPRVRRLNRIEYLNTLRDLFQIREIRLPPTFPEETNDFDFDTTAEGMYVTPALLDAYLEVATDLADRMVPLPGMPQVRSVSTRENIGQDEARTRFWTREGDDAGLYFSGLNLAGWSGGFWDTGFTAPASGVYRVSLTANAEAAKGADGKPLRLGFYALNVGDYDLPKRALRARLPLAGSLEVTNREPEVVHAEVRLEKGEKFHVYCDNRLTKQYPPALMREPGNTADLRQLLKVYLQESLDSGEPTIRFERMVIEGPVGPLPRQQAFLKHEAPRQDPAYIEAVLAPLAERAFRRPLTAREREELIASVLAHMAKAAAPELGIHYGIRRILTSPQFLYREVGEGELDGYGLASRLSYFLWSSMPDADLLAAARSGLLSEREVLRAQLLRMSANPKARQFVKHFTGQWLGNRKASSVMVCDTRHVWSELIRHGMVRGTEMFFDEVLQRNLSIRTFLDSDFTYANEPMRIAWGVPGNEVDLRRLEADRRQSLLWPEPERLDLTELGPEIPAHVAGRGGVLGLSSVLAATGDGVDSSPILRGVWVLENLLGTPPPPPPSDVPALVADTSQAQTVREILAAHKKVESCAVCHRNIDPIGLALETYDAVGGWRTAYYREDVEPEDRTPVDARATLPDGTALDGPADLKRYLLARSHQLTRGLTEKLLLYATGRSSLTAEDRRTVRQIVDAEPAEGYGFRDLLIAVVQSEAFRRK